MGFLTSGKVALTTTLNIECIKPVTFLLYYLIQSLLILNLRQVKQFNTKLISDALLTVLQLYFFIYLNLFQTARFLKSYNSTLQHIHWKRKIWVSAGVFFPRSSESLDWSRTFHCFHLCVAQLFHLSYSPQTYLKLKFISFSSYLYCKDNRRGNTVEIHTDFNHFNLNRLLQDFKVLAFITFLPPHKVKWLNYKYVLTRIHRNNTDFWELLRTQLLIGLVLKRSLCPFSIKTDTNNIDIHWGVYIMHPTEASWMFQ